MACHCGLQSLSADELASLSLRSKSSHSISTAAPGGVIHSSNARLDAEEISRIFGTAQLFSDVKSLINQKLLIPVNINNHSSLLDPLYQSNIPRQLAEAVASYVKFPLQDFIYEEE